MLRILIGILLGTSLLPSAARANAATFNFTGTVTQVPIDDLATGIQPSELISGSFTFQPAALDAISAPTTGSYTSTGASFGMLVTIGPAAKLFSVSGGLNIGILNAFVDQYAVHAASGSLILDFLFQDNSSAVFSSDGLPQSPPPLAGFAQRDFHLDQTDTNTDETQIDGTISALRCGQGCVTSTVPERASGWLPLRGTILLISRRRL